VTNQEEQPNFIGPTELHSFLITPAQFQFLSNGGQKGQAAAKLRQLIDAAMNPQPPQATVPVAVQATAPAALLAELEAVLAELVRATANSGTNLEISFDHVDKMWAGVLLYADGDHAAHVWGNTGMDIDSATFARYLALACNLAPFLLQERQQRLEAVTAARTDAEIIDRLRLRLQEQEAIHESLVLRFGKLTVENMNLRDVVMGNAREVAKLIMTEKDIPTAYLSHPLFALFTQDMAEAFIETGAKNYLTIEMHSDLIGNVIATFQKENGKTPIQRIREAEAESQRLRDRLLEAEADAAALFSVMNAYASQLGPNAWEVLNAHEDRIKRMEESHD
jgi:hypothetical protein